MRRLFSIAALIPAAISAGLLTASCSTGDDGLPGNPPAQATFSTGPQEAESQTPPVASAPAFPPFPAGAAGIQAAQQPSVLASLNRYRAGHSFSADLPAAPGSEKAASLKISALLHMPDGQNVRHIAVLA